MPNVKISAAADAGTLLSSDMLPLARSGSSNAYHATMAEIATFASVAAASGTYNNNGRNLLQNTGFTVAQRGSGAFTASGYTLDRWVYNNPGAGSGSITQQQCTDSDRAAIGDEAASYFLDNVFTGGSAAGDYQEILQRIEGVRRLSGKTVTLSFWAKASAAGLKLGINGSQWFGTGGTPSAEVDVLATGLSVTLTTAWARYSVSYAIPSATGKTLGTNGDDYTTVEFGYSSGSTNNAFFGNIGVQSGSIYLWGVQLEIGSAATPLEKLGPQLELANCQRFYLPGEYSVISTAAGAGSYVGGVAYFPTTMRAPPTITVAASGSDINVSTTSAPDAITAGGFRFSFTSMAAGYIEAVRTFTASAEL